MKTFFKINTAIAIAATILFGIVIALGVTARKKLADKDQELMTVQAKLDSLKEKEKRSAVMQHVNAQMEEIANEERRISDEQREEAIQQKKVADEMRRKAEEERQNALDAEQRAIEASNVAQHQRIIAEQQRSEAELSKRTADTLTYISLARTLGQAAITQYKTDNNETSELLTQAACFYTNRYNGDIYFPTVYQALAMNSANKAVWAKHKGSVTDIAFSDVSKGYMVTCSTYGEVIKHTHYGEQRLNSEVLVSNPKYDFRDIYIDRTTDNIYALSRSSHLIIIDKHNNIKVLEINIANLKIMEIAGTQAIIFGEKGMALFDLEKNVITKEKSLPYQIEFVSRSKNKPVIFDRQGNMHLVKSFNDIETTKVPFKGQVTAFAMSNNTNQMAYGMSDGTIYLVNPKGESSQLVGHRSRISELKADGYRLYSASYDGSLNLWVTNNAKIEPMTLFTTRGWIINFTFDPKKDEVWSGDQYGNLTEALISVPQMQKRLAGKLKRDLTREEWDFYVGKNIPYERITALVKSDK